MLAKTWKIVKTCFPLIINKFDIWKINSKNLLSLNRSKIVYLGRSVNFFDFNICSTRSVNYFDFDIVLIRSVNYFDFNMF